MQTPTEWAAAITSVAAIYTLTAWVLGPLRRKDPALWIGTSMAGLLVLGGLAGPVFGETGDQWEVVAGIALALWAWRRWRRVSRAHENHLPPTPTETT